MTGTIKKYVFFRLTGLLFCLLLLVFSGLGEVLAARIPYTLETAFYRADTLPLPLAENNSPPALFLAVTAVPDDPGLYLYASHSQARGKVAELGIFVGGVSVRSHAVFPLGAEKPDPLRPGETTRVFQGPFTILVPLPENLIGEAKLTARLTGLTCSDVNCTPITLEKSVRIPGRETFKSLPDAAVSSWWPALQSGVVEVLATASVSESAAPKMMGFPLTPGFAQTGPIVSESEVFLATIRPQSFTPDLEVASVGKAVLLGFLAGIILNLMPCVLPVLGIKLAALLTCGGDAGERVRRFRRHQLFFACGILTWFTVMAALFYFLDLTWGQVFQSPVVVLILAVFLLLLALNLFGVLALPLIDFRSGTYKRPDLEAFASGFAATLLATPCGGPLLGGVLSWALMQPLGTLTLTLESVGLGMAFPYLLLALFPSLALKLPRPGIWMGVLEQVLGFLLLGTVAYLVSFLPSGIMPRALAALVLTAFGGWLWGRSVNLDAVKYYTLRAVAVICVAFACLWPFQERQSTVIWTPYSHAGLAVDLGKRMVLVDFTADWCPTCKVVEATALTDEALETWKKHYDLALFRVDMTSKNPEGEALLKAVGSASIPVIAIFGFGENAHTPQVMRDVVTKGQVSEALERASQPPE